MIVLSKYHCSPSRGNFYRNDFLRQVTRILSSFSLLLGSQSIFILLFPRDLKLASQILSGSGHRRIAIGIEQRNHETVFEFATAQWEP